MRRISLNGLSGPSLTAAAPLLCGPSELRLERWVKADGFNGAENGAGGELDPRELFFPPGAVVLPARLDPLLLRPVTFMLPWLVSHPEQPLPLPLPVLERPALLKLLSLP